jgi:hypothetical protein
VIDCSIRRFNYEPSLFETVNEQTFSAADYWTAGCKASERFWASFWASSSSV